MDAGERFRQVLRKNLSQSEAAAEEEGACCSDCHDILWRNAKKCGEKDNGAAVQSVVSHGCEMRGLEAGSATETPKEQRGHSRRMHSGGGSLFGGSSSQSGWWLSVLVVLFATVVSVLADCPGTDPNGCTASDGNYCVCMTSDVGDEVTVFCPTSSALDSSQLFGTYFHICFCFYLADCSATHSGGAVEWHHLYT